MKIGEQVDIVILSTYQPAVWPLGLPKISPGAKHRGVDTNCRHNCRHTKTYPGDWLRRLPATPVDSTRWAQVPGFESDTFLERGAHSEHRSAELRDFSIISLTVDISTRFGWYSMVLGDIL